MVELMLNRHNHKDKKIRERNGAHEKADLINLDFDRVH